MPDHIPLPAKQYSVIYADPPWAYSQGGNTKSSHGIAKQHYPTMTTAEICALPVREIVRGGAACFMWATFPNITEAIKVMEAWGFTYKTAAFVWVKKNRKQGGNFMGLGAYTRANAEVCLLGVTPGFKAKTQIRAHNVHQIIEAPFEGHSKKPDETRQRIVELLGDVPRLEMFARQRADGWDAWGCCMTCARQACTTLKENAAGTRKRACGRITWAIRSGIPSPWGTEKRACTRSPALSA